MLFIPQALPYHSLFVSLIARHIPHAGKHEKNTTYDTEVVLHMGIGMQKRFRKSNNKCIRILYYIIFFHLWKPFSYLHIFCIDMRSILQCVVNNIVNNISTWYFSICESFFICLYLYTYVFNFTVNGKIFLKFGKKQSIF